MAKMKQGVPRVPDHIIAQYGTARKWKALKRRHLRAAYDALQKLRVGSAFFPCGSGPISRATNELEIVYRAINAEAWGR